MLKSQVCGGGSQGRAQEEVNQVVSQNCSCKSGNEAPKGSRVNLQTKKLKGKGKGEQRESRLKWLTRNLKKIYLQKTEKLKNESPTADEAGEKEAKTD